MIDRGGKEETRYLPGDLKGDVVFCGDLPLYGAALGAFVMALSLSLSCIFSFTVAVCAVKGSLATGAPLGDIRTLAGLPKVLLTGVEGEEPFTLTLMLTGRLLLTGLVTLVGLAPALVALIGLPALSGLPVVLIGLLLFCAPFFTLTSSLGDFSGVRHI